MGIPITILILIICALLAMIILVQNPKTGGLSSGFSSGNQFGGVRKTADFLEKATWYLAIALMVVSIWTARGVQSSVPDDGTNIQQAEEQPQ